PSDASLSVGTELRRGFASWNNARKLSNTMRDSKAKYPTCGFRNQVGSIVQWNWSHIPLWVISGIQEIYNARKSGGSRRGAIIGLAFGAIVNSIVNDIIMTIIGAITGGLDFSN